MRPPLANRASTATEIHRLRALRRYRLLDTAREGIFDDLTQLAASSCDVPMAVISLVDAERVWFKSAFGTAAEVCPRQGFPCAQTVWEDDLFVVPDLALDARFPAVGPLSEGERSPRFYAGVPLRTEAGYGLGALGVLDHRPRTLKGRCRESLLALGRQVVAQMELKRSIASLQREALARERAERALRESEARFREFMNHGPALAYIKDAEGRFLYVNDPMARTFQRPVERWLGRTDADIIGPSAAQPIQEHDLTVFNNEEMVVSQEIVATPDGQTRYWLSYKFLLGDSDGQKRLGGLSFDITDRKATEREHERLISELREALAQVKTLSGFIPICASCKNIRDDAGYWQQIEEYLGKHSGVEFTHGICPPCLEKLYPEFAARQRESTEDRA